MKKLLIETMQYLESKDYYRLEEQQKIKESLLKEINTITEKPNPCISCQFKYSCSAIHHLLIDPI